jgi:ribokinase
VAPVRGVTVVGSANLDLVASVERCPLPGETLLASGYAEHPGGKGLNQAVAASRSGAATAFVAAIGADDAGRRLLDVVRAEGIDASSVEVVEAPTGRALISVGADGENSIVVVPGANAALVWRDAPPRDVVLAQLEVPMEEVARAFAAARRTGARTVLNPAPARSLPAGLLANCDVVVPNEHELDLVGGVAALLGAGVGAVVVTRGALGVEVTEAGGLTWTEPALQVDVVDTTGAGDAFCGALAARLAAGDALCVAVQWAVAAGALATTVAGAVPSMPTAGAISVLLSAAGRELPNPLG